MCYLLNEKIFLKYCLLCGCPVCHTVNQISGHFQLLYVVSRWENVPINPKILLAVIVFGEMAEQELGGMVVNLQSRPSRQLIEIDRDDLLKTDAC